MSSFGKHGQTGGGGVKPRGGGGSAGAGGYGGSGHGGQDRSQPDDTCNNYWRGRYLEASYFDESGNLRIEYVSRCLPEDANLPEGRQHGCEPLIRAMAHARPALTTGQLRRFFGHCRTLETKLKSGASTWPQVRPSFEFLGAAAADAFGKSPQKIPGLFYDFIRRNVAAVHTEKDFLRGFLPHFEALMGFGSLHVQKDRN